MAGRVSSKPPIEPVRRRLPRRPLRSDDKFGADQFPAYRVIPLGGEAPEDVVVDTEGRLLTGVEDGRILRIDPRARTEEAVGEVGGRPLGLEALSDGRVLICNPGVGLMRLDPASGRTEVLASEAGGLPIRFCSNATALSDGSVWITESTTRFDFPYYRGAIVEHRGSGRLMRLDPDGTLEVVLDQLHFPNGLSATVDESAVLFVETDGYTINRVPLGGPLAGKRQVVRSNLPGFPDNMSRPSDGRHWIAMVGPRNRVLDMLGPAPSFAKRALWKLPDALSPDAEPTTWVMAFDENADVIADYQAPLREFSFVTGVAETSGCLYLASLQTHSLLELRLSD